ncbi:hypothetical protein [Bacteroides reticulotermitis]|uniref:Uncharacterized protein n=2 Tax=Bacteroides reticulotermitis TaxID=1133319 RepID=W4UMX3_9BACE|nr:hypothetical protein [Bacteroides reticulotermitis]MBB4044696.1 hypothetical protein [Bacteroides reticulotermitis]GAE82311.1 hypothetical protein JCM10512_506 [Bacteroides reticulotermitis JCM 10512]HJD75822.1 hypothetical protein [Bacteroides reticulotermitis]
MKLKSKKLENSWTLWLLAFLLIPLGVSAQSIIRKRKTIDSIGDLRVGALNVL